jgi:hypothetical protein
LDGEVFLEFMDFILRDYEVKEVLLGSLMNGISNVYCDDDGGYLCPSMLGWCGLEDITFL